MSVRHILLVEDEEDLGEQIEDDIKQFLRLNGLEATTDLTWVTTPEKARAAFTAIEARGEIFFIVFFDLILETLPAGRYRSPRSKADIEGAALIRDYVIDTDKPANQQPKRLVKFPAVLSGSQNISKITDVLLLPDEDDVPRFSKSVSDGGGYPNNVFQFLSECFGIADAKFPE